MSITADTAKQLREKFPVERIGLKPKITCKACSNSQTRACGEHSKTKCADCKQWITPKHMHVEFVGHANVTDRLLEVDPEWSWEPMAFGSDGLPAFDGNGGLWIRLTVAGVSRIGYGGADGKRGEDAVKEAIGDAIKVAAMRFGVGLDLWRKEEASGKPSDDHPAPPAGGADPPEHPAVTARKRLAGVCEENGWDLARVAARFLAQYDQPLGEATDVNRINEFTKNLFSVSDAELKAAPARATNGAG